jgi:hypothetical protein
MKIKVYSIESEDQGLWFPHYLTKSKEKAQKTIEQYCKDNDCTSWIKNRLINIIEAELDD